MRCVNKFVLFIRDSARVTLRYIATFSMKRTNNQSLSQSRYNSNVPIAIKNGELTRGDNASRQRNTADIGNSSGNVTIIKRFNKRSSIYFSGVRLDLTNSRLRMQIADEIGFPLVQILLARLHLARPTADVVVDFLSLPGIQHISSQSWLRLPQNGAQRFNLGEMFLRVPRQIWIYPFLARTGIKPHAETFMTNR